MDKQTGKLIARIAENLPMMSRLDVQYWIERPKELQAFLSGLSRTKTRSGELMVWKTITLGGFGFTSGPHYMHEAFRRSKFSVHDGWWMRDLFRFISRGAAVKEVEVDLIKISVAELGFPDGGTYPAICARAGELGLKLCPPRLGLDLAIQYDDQPPGERLVVGMEGIQDSDFIPRVFSLYSDNKGRSWLGAHTIMLPPSHVWNSESVWVFVRPRVV